MQGVEPTKKVYFGFTAYQWLVLFAAWLGWGFDVFDALLFNYVGRLCIPALLHRGPIDSQTITHWTGVVTSILLVGWAIGGVLFGKLTDRLGRTRTLLLTMLTYALATAACAAANNIWTLLLFRFIASLGIGGEWAAGASLVAETVPENKRVQAGALLYTSAPFGLFLATFVTDLFTRQLDYFVANSDAAWRAVFLTGIIPAAIAILIRLKVKEPEMWRADGERPRLSELFAPGLRRRTLGGLVMAAVALITWWSCNAFLPVVASFLAHDLVPPLSGAALEAAKARLVTLGTVSFNLGGLMGSLLTAPIALHFGRRSMFVGYFSLGALMLWCTFRLPLAPETRLYLLFFDGLTVFGVFGSFTFYLPELFPTRLRGTGSGFCYNIGRVITAAGPFIVGSLAQSAHDSHAILSILSWLAIVPLVGVAFVLLGYVPETRAQALTNFDGGDLVKA